MPQIKAPDVNWLDEAWRLLEVVGTMPSHPPSKGMLTSLEPYRKSTDYWMAAPDKREAIEMLQTTIAHHLAYRLDTYYKVRPDRRDGRRHIYLLKTRDPAVVQAFYRQLTEKGLKFSPPDVAAFTAHIRLGLVLNDRFVGEDWKRSLPMLVASISGESISQRARLLARQPRKRVNELLDAKRDAWAQFPDATWKELLDMLEGNGIVTRWSPDVVEWAGLDQKPKVTKTGTFKNWKRTAASA